MRRHILGLTGGIATGKSALTALLVERLHARSFDADACVSDLLDHDPETRREICKALHPDAYGSDGRADRGWLRERIFGNPLDRKTLESILHPRVRVRCEAEASACRQEGVFLVVEMPLLYEAGFEGVFDTVIVVAASESRRIERLTAPSGLTREMAKKMIDSQWPLEDKIKRAGYVVWNDGSWEALFIQADLLSKIFHV